MKHSLLFAAILLVSASQIASAQLPPIPDMTLKCDGVSLKVHNPTQQEYLIVNATVFWEERNESWTEYPQDMIITARGDTRLHYSMFVKDFDPKKDAGMPSVVSFMLLNEDYKYIALYFRLSPDGEYLPDEGMNAELTKLYQSMPVPDHQKSRR